MAKLDKTALIGALADSFKKTDDEGDLDIDRLNYIDTTKSLDCTVSGISVDTLQKTKRVIEQQITAFNRSGNPKKAQYVAHLDVAKKCVEEMISQKLRG